MNQKKDFQDNAALSGEKEAWNFALKILGISPKSRNEMLERLKTKGFDAALAEKTVGRLEAAGYLNDRALALSLVSRMASSRKGFGKRKAAFELKRRGFEPGAASEALEELTSDVQREAAEALVQSVWEKAKKLEPLKRKKKLFDTLVRRGFDFEMAKHVIETFIRKAGDEARDDVSGDFF